LTGGTGDGEESCEVAEGDGETGGVVGEDSNEVGDEDESGIF